VKIETRKYVLISRGNRGEGLIPDVDGARELVSPTSFVDLLFDSVARIKKILHQKEYSAKMTLFVSSNFYLMEWVSELCYVVILFLDFEKLELVRTFKFSLMIIKLLFL